MLNFIFYLNRGLCFSFIFALFFSQAYGLFCQDWEKEAIKDRGGNITGYSFFQDNYSAIATPQRGIDVAVIVSSTVRVGGDYLQIDSFTLNELQMHPASDDLRNLNVTFTVKNNNSSTSYSGRILANLCDYDRISIISRDSSLITKLQGTEEWDALIEGTGWSIKFKLKGNLPK
jgi:hypothetical protein